MRAVLGLVALFALCCMAACTGKATRHTNSFSSASVSSSAVSRPDPALAGACGTKSQAILDPVIGAIVKAQGSGIAAQALVQSASFPVPVGVEIKIVWRITGSGTPTFTTSGPDAATAQQTFGPDLHGGSNWNAPGDEWGTGVEFPQAGCWAIQVTQTTGSATAWLGVGS